MQLGIENDWTFSVKIFALEYFFSPTNNPEFVFKFKIFALLGT